MAELILSWPSWLRLIIALVLYCGITIAILAVFRDRIIALGNSDPWPYFPRTRDEKREADETSPPGPPDSVYLRQQVSQWVGMAFVFLLAFTVSNLWSNAEQARMLTKNETFTFGSRLRSGQPVDTRRGPGRSGQGWTSTPTPSWPNGHAARRRCRGRGEGAAYGVAGTGLGHEGGRPEGRQQGRRMGGTDLRRRRSDQRRGGSARRHPVGPGSRHAVAVVPPGTDHLGSDRGVPVGHAGQQPLPDGPDGGSRGSAHLFRHRDQQPVPGWRRSGPGIG